jgi:hypothetical protein
MYDCPNSPHVVALPITDPCRQAAVSIAQLVHPASIWTNYTYTGCYTYVRSWVTTIVCSQLIVCSDTVAKRTLTGATLASSSMTNAQCVFFCSTKKMYYAGTEYSQECYCGSVLQNGATQAADADCNMPCAGNTTESCGGPNRLTVFNTTIPPGPVGPFVNPGVYGFRELGCYRYLPCFLSPAVAQSMNVELFSDAHRQSGNPSMQRHAASYRLQRCACDENAWPITITSQCAQLLPLSAWADRTSLSRSQLTVN